MNSNYTFGLRGSLALGSRSAALAATAHRAPAPAAAPAPAPAPAAAPAAAPRAPAAATRAPTTPANRFSITRLIHSKPSGGCRSCS